MVSVLPVTEHSEYNFQWSMSSVLLSMKLTFLMIHYILLLPVEGDMSTADVAIGLSLELCKIHYSVVCYNFTPQVVVRSLSIIPNLINFFL